MKDIDLTEDFDINISGSEIKMTDSVKTAVTISVLSDARASAFFVSDPLKRRGWIGDLNAVYPIGSLIWIYTAQGRISNEIVNNIRSQVSSSLSWVPAEYNGSLDVSVEAVDNYSIRILVSVIIGKNFYYEYTVGARS